MANFPKMDLISRELNARIGARLIKAIREGHKDIQGIDCDLNLLFHGMTEAWYEGKRPYVNVWPSILGSLLKVKLDGVTPDIIPKSILHDLSIEVRMPEESKIDPFLMKLCPADMFEGRTQPSFELITYVNPSGNDPYLLKNSMIFGEEIVQVYDDPTMNDYDGMVVNRMTRIAVGLLLLASQEGYMEQILTVKDQKRKLTGEALERAKKRAVNRLKHRAFNLGRTFQQSPHKRGSYFAIRWTGPGRKVPVMTPVRGYTVNKDLLDKIPTGYEDDDEKESQ